MPEDRTLIEISTKLGSLEQLLSTVVERLKGLVDVTTTNRDRLTLLESRNQMLTDQLAEIREWQREFLLRVLKTSAAWLTLISIIMGGLIWLIRTTAQ